MLIEVLTQVASDTGYNKTQQRDALLLLLQKAADKMHKMLGCNAIHREVTLVVQPDSIVSLPSFVGELIGMRMHTNELPFDQATLSSPRYVSTTLSYKFKNWRILNNSPVAIYPASGPLVFEIQSNNDNAIDILVAGQSTIAAAAQEILTTNGSVTNTATAWIKISKIACLADRTADIIVRDINNVEVARLYTSDKQTRYKLVDVSQIFWTLDTNDGSSFIDVCYKLPLTKLVNDSDSFYAGDEYDVAWHHMCMHMYYNTLPGRETDAAYHMQMALSSMASVKDSVEGQIIKKFSFGRNKFFGIFRKYRYFPGSVTNVDHNVQT